MLALRKMKLLYLMTFISIECCAAQFYYTTQFQGWPTKADTTAAEAAEEFTTVVSTTQQPKDGCCPSMQAQVNELLTKVNQKFPVVGNSYFTDNI